MRRAFQQHCIVWLVLAAYLLLPLGNGVVWCESIDGHATFELSHGEGACAAPLMQQDASDTASRLYALSPDCQDTPLDALISIEPVPPRSQPINVVLLPPTLLPTPACVDADDDARGSVHLTGPPPAASLLDAMRGVVLLI